MVVRDDDARDVLGGESKSGKGFDEHGLTGVVGPAGVHQRHSVIAQDGVDVHRPQIPEGQRQGNSHDVRRQLALGGFLRANGQTVFRHLGNPILRRQNRNLTHAKKCVRRAERRAGVEIP